MFGRRKREASAGSTSRRGLIPSVVAIDMHVLGNIVTEGMIDIDGTIEGNVRCHAATVRHNAKIRGDLMADEVHVYGAVEGMIKARSVMLYSGAKVIGTIMHEVLSIEDGAHVDGKCKRTERVADDEKRPTPVEISFHNDNDEAPTEAELIVLENLRLIR